VLRWDKGDLAAYYSLTGQLLQNFLCHIIYCNANVKMTHVLIKQILIASIMIYYLF